MYINKVYIMVNLYRKCIIFYTGIYDNPYYNYNIYIYIYI